MSQSLPKGIELKAPLTREAVRQLRAGDIVYISGQLWSADDRIFIGVFQKGRELPLDTKQYNAMLVARGFTMRIGDEWVPLHSTPVTTTGFRYAKWIPQAIRRFDLRMVSCKDGVSNDAETIRACKECDCVTTAVFAFPPKVVPHTCQEVAEVTWPEALQAGTMRLRETNFIYEANKYGPLVINIDTKGNCFMEEISQKVDARAAQAYERMGIAGFEYAKM
ncbi:hypothetical protein ACFLUZ_01510 [Chloroflexota bacterium]